MKILFETFVQIILLVAGVFAFSYLMGDTFGGIEIVSAIELTEEEIAGMRDAFPGIADSDITTVIDWLIANGYLSDEQGRNPEAVAAAVQQLGIDFNQGVDHGEETGEVTDALANILSFFSNLLPFLGQVGVVDIRGDFLDRTGGVQTCPESSDNKICQQYFANNLIGETGIVSTPSTCRDKCKGDCINQPIEEITSGECQLITCYDEEEGMCSERSTRKKCTDTGGIVIDDPRGNDPKCTKGCCVFEGGVDFITQGRCEKLANSTGKVFGEDIRWEQNDLNGDSATTQDECFALATELEMGACVFPLGDGSGENGCKFTTKKGCEEIIVNPDAFKVDKLCSFPDLNSVCVAKNHTGCVDGKDGVYWFDSCGNRENIYDGARDDFGWNGGIVLPENQSCLVGNGGNPVANQATCGNCNRFLSSHCGSESTSSPTQELFDQDHGVPDGDVVCLDMGCYNDLGIRIRENGESWCAYQSSIGLPGLDIPELDSFRSLVPINPLENLIGGVRSTDTPGSNHFRMSCLDGVIQEPVACQGYRNYICVEQQTPKDNNLLNTFSQASCRVNRWQECLAYNPDMILSQIFGLAGKKSGDVTKLWLDLRCGLDPDCFVKTVDLTSDSDDTFKFSYCAPRYPPGSSLDINALSIMASDQLCAQVSNRCTSVWIKKITGWECELNCDCEDGDPDSNPKPSDKFLREMNELCTSVGDCGRHVNYKGIPGFGGYTTSVSICDISDDNCGSTGSRVGIGDIDLERIPQDVIGLVPNPHVEDATPTMIPFTEYVQASGGFLDAVRGKWMDDTLQQIGILDLFSGFTNTNNNNPNAVNPSNPGLDVTKVGLMTGGIGVGIAAGAFGATQASLGLTVSGITSASIGPMMAPVAGFGIATAAGGAAVAITGVLLDITGVGAGLPDAATVGLMAVAGDAGMTMGWSVLGIGPSPGGLANICWYPAACIVFVAVIATILILGFVFGVGEKKKIVVGFTCRPWTPPLVAPPLLAGCELCGQDTMSDGGTEFPCSDYACRALGQNCEFIQDTEGEGGGACITFNPLDVNPPKIKETIGKDLSAGFEYADNLDVLIDNQFRIRKQGEQECLTGLESVTFGFNLDEYGRCSISANPDTPYENMVPLNRGRLSRSHSYEFNVGYLFDSTGSLNFNEQLVAGERSEIKLFIVCEDYHGYKNYPTPLYWVDFCVIPNSDRLIQGIENVDRFQRFFQHGAEDSNGGEGDSDSTLTVAPLTIDYISPADGVTIPGRTPRVSIPLEVETTGGVDGDVTCRYKIDNGAESIMSTSRNVHTISMDLFAGLHTAEVTCGSGEGSPVTITSSFTIEVDSNPPSITRVYNDNGELVVVTDENSECGFTNTDCGFNVDNGEGTIMAGKGVVHRTAFSEWDKYYINCEDESGNQMPDCFVVKRGSV